MGNLVRFEDEAVGDGDDDEVDPEAEGEGNRRAVFLRASRMCPELGTSIRLSRDQLWSWCAR